jgi:hypothetical protein
MFQLQRTIIGKKKKKVLVHSMIVHTVGFHIVYIFNHTRIIDHM